MSTIGQGVFAARKVRQREMLIAKMNMNEPRYSSQQYTESKLMELAPLKYNSKLMNSIWGLYNRYSVHNFKQNTDAKDRMFGNISGLETQQQRDAVGTLNTDTKAIFDKAFSTVTPTLWNSS